MASTSARPKGVRPPCGGFFHAATRCSCSDRRPRISAAGSLRSPRRLPALSGWLRRHPETDPASRTGSRRLPPVRARGFRDPRRAATAGSLPPCVWPTSVPGRRAALREPLRSPFGLPAGLPKLVLSLCSQTPPCVISHSFSPQFGVQENPRAREEIDGLKTEIKKLEGEIGFFFVDEDKVHARKLLIPRRKNLLSQLEQISKRNETRK